VRDFVRSLRGNDKLGMGMAMAGMIPVAGGMAKVAGKADDAARLFSRGGPLFKELQAVSRAAPDDVQRAVKSSLPGVVGGAFSPLDEFLSSANRQKLIDSYAPGRDAIRRSIGDEVTLYRGHGTGTTPIAGKPHVYFTADPADARRFAGSDGHVIEAQLSVDDILGMHFDDNEYHEFFVNPRAFDGSDVWSHRSPIRTTETVPLPKIDEAALARDKRVDFMDERGRKMSLRDEGQGLDLYDSYGNHVTGYSALRDFLSQLERTREVVSPAVVKVRSATLNGRSSR
jgi:hypothetical protein